jgi:hypothetical protein
MTRTAAPPSRPAEPNGPRQVSKFEYNLLRILRFFLGHYAQDQGLQLVRTSAARPDCLSPAAVHLVRDTLAKGAVLYLVREGGWRDDRYLRDGEPVGGRVWHRVPLDERVLEFSRHVVEFLLWATAEKVHETRAAWDAPPDELTPADELFFWLAFDACRPDPDLVAVLRRKTAFHRNPLAWITFPGDLAETEQPEPPDFRPLFTGLRAVILECLQPHLTRRWVVSERAKGQVGDWRRMRLQGRAEYAALHAFLAAAAAANRTDLARFVLKTNAALFQADLTPVFWTGGLQGSGPPRLADRLDTQRSALAVPRQMAALAGWQQRARTVGYFDEGYAASQLWKQDWEAANGDAVAARAHAAVEQLEPFRAAAAGGQPGPAGESPAAEPPADSPG